MKFKTISERWDAQRVEMERILAKHNIAWPECGAEVGFGWLPIVEEAIDKMVSVGWNKQLDQVKQKFCQLRIYASRCDTDGAIVDEISMFINQAEAKANVACEDCGKPHGLQVPRSGSALCEICREHRNQEKY